MKGQVVPTKGSLYYSSFACIRTKNGGHTVAHPSSAVLVGTFLVQLTLTLFATLMVKEFPVAIDEVLWNDIWLLNRVFIWWMSIPAAKVTHVVFCADLTDEMINDVQIEAIFSIMCRRIVFFRCMCHFPVFSSHGSGVLLLFSSSSF